VVINAQGHYSVNERNLVNNSPETLKAAIREAAGDDRSLPLVITADANTPHQAVITAMDAAGQLGFARLSLATRESDGK
jgi:biopolymer transport protein ExbD